MFFIALCSCFFSQSPASRQSSSSLDSIEPVAHWCVFCKVRLATTCLETSSSSSWWAESFDKGVSWLYISAATAAALSVRLRLKSKSLNLSCHLSIHFINFLNLPSPDFTTSMVCFKASWKSAFGNISSKQDSLFLCDGSSNIETLISSVVFIASRQFRSSDGMPTIDFSFSIIWVIDWEEMVMVGHHRAGLSESSHSDDVPKGWMRWFTWWLKQASNSQTRRSRPWLERHVSHANTGNFLFLSSPKIDFDILW